MLKKQFLENRLSIMNSEAPLSTIWEKVLELGDLKKSYCQCKIHQEDRRDQSNSINYIFTTLVETGNL